MPQLERPATLRPENIPEALRQWPHWVCWRYPDKAPLHPVTGHLASIRDPSAHASFDVALATQDFNDLGGIGVVQLNATPFVILDLDNTGALDSVPDWLPVTPTYTERSPSGNGLRLVYLLGDQERPQDFMNRAAGVECYAGGGLRYLTITGDKLPNVPDSPVPIRYEDIRILDKLRPATMGARGADADPMPSLDTLPRITKAEFLDMRSKVVAGRPDIQVFIDTGEVQDGSALSLALSIKMRGVTNWPKERMLAAWLCPGMEKARAWLFRPGGMRAGRQSLESQATWLWQQVIHRATALVELDNPVVDAAELFGKPETPDAMTEAAKDEYEEASKPDPSPGETISELIAKVEDLGSPEAEKVVEWIAKQPTLRREKYIKTLAKAVGGGSTAAIRTAVAEVSKADDKEDGGKGIEKELGANVMGQLRSYVYVAVQDAMYDLRTHTFCPMIAVATKVKCTTEQLRKLVGAVIPVADQLGYVPGGEGIVEEIKPGHVQPVKVANTWLPSQYAPWPEKVTKDDVMPWLDLFDRMNIIKDMLDPEYGHEEYTHVNTAKAILDWMAFTVQHPGEKLNWGILFGGIPGAGKDSLFRPLAEIFGENYYAIGQTEAQSEFSDFLSSTKLLAISEICPGGKKDSKDNTLLYNRLKTWIATDATGRLQVNPKGVTPYTITNRLAVVAFTNYPYPLRMDPGDRRFLCIWTDIAMSAPRKAAYQQALTDYHVWLDEDNGVEKVYRFLMDRDLSKFNPMGWPLMTQWKQHILAESNKASGTDVDGMLPPSLLAEDFLTFEHVQRVLHAGGLMKVDNQVLGAVLRDNGYVPMRAQGVRVWVKEALVMMNGWSQADAVRFYLSQNKKD